MYCTIEVVQDRKTIAMPKWLTLTLLGGLGTILVLMPVHAFLSTWGGSAIGPLWAWKSWKELLLVALALLAIGWMVSRPRVFHDLARKPLVLVLSAYLLLTVLMALLNWQENGADATSAGLAMNLRYLGVAALAYLLWRYSALEDWWLDRAVWFVMGAGVVVAVLGIVQVLVLPADFLSTFGYDKYETIAPASLIDNNPDLLRAFATLRGPNDFGAFLILPILLTVAYARRLPIALAASMVAVMVWALALSSSRSAFLGLIAALVVYLVLRLGRKLTIRQISAGIVSLIVAAGLVLYAAVTVPSVRMAVFHSSPDDPSLTEGSTDNHIAATLGGVQRVVDDPLGCGPGCAGPASYYGNDPKISENYVVQIAEESGVAGAGLFMATVAIAGLATYRAERFRGLGVVLVSALGGYAVIAMLLHVWADDPLSITWWMLAGALIGYNERNSWKKSKTSSRSRTSSSS